MPDGGKVGWYTNWKTPGSTAQSWADFHLTQLIPWIDANLRTIAAKNGRAIAGLSMGGFGAVRYAQDRPDLFAYVASFSGAVDLGDSGTRAVVTEQATQYGFNPYGPFGNPFWPLDGTWNALNPLNRASRLQGVGVALYAGGGSTTRTCSRGRCGRRPTASTTRSTPPASRTSTGCTGAPGPRCPSAATAATTSAAGTSRSTTRCRRSSRRSGRRRDRLRAPRRSPTATSRAPASGRGPARATAAPTTAPAWRGPAPATAGSATRRAGTTSTRRSASPPNRTYTVSAWIRTSANNNDGYFGLRTPGGQVVGEQRFTRLDGYTKVTATVNSGSNTTLVVYAGLWANGDTWAQVDDVTVVQQWLGERLALYPIEFW